MSFVRLMLFLCWVGSSIERSAGFVATPAVATPSVTHVVTIPMTTLPSRERKQELFASSGSNDGMETTGGDDEFDGEEELSSTPSFETTSLRINDGGSNLTDRFKYKVHALMGDYDPTEGVADNEDQNGNIMKAFITFPTQHVFDVVGKAAAVANGQEYADRVKDIVFDTTGDDDIECEVIPRGTKFVKVRCKAVVESTTMINTIYEELGKMESTVMKF